MQFDFFSHFLQIYNEKRSQFDVKRNSPKDLVDRVAKDIAKLLNSKRKALEVRASQSDCPTLQRREICAASLLKNIFISAASSLLGPFYQGSDRLGVNRPL